MFSVLILTKNEEIDIADCIKSVYPCDDIHVVDSYSTDKTKEIVLSLNVIFHEKKFEGYASQRNYGLHNISFKYKWLLILDADERVPMALLEELNLITTKDDLQFRGYSIKRRDYYKNTWLRYSQISPYFIRFIRPEYCKYDREVNEVIHVNGSVGYVINHFNHYPFSKGIDHWIYKHNIYSSMEAKRNYEEQLNQLNFSLKKALFSTNFYERRFHQKGLACKMPFRPMLKWLYILFIKGGILDGRAGLEYASLQSIYEYFIVVKLKDIRRQQNNE